MRPVHDPAERGRLLEAEIERRLAERFAALREEFERLRLESDGRWAGFASRFEQRLAGIVPAELLSPGFEPPGRPGHLSIEAARDLDAATTQVEILNRLLRICLRSASRAMLLVLRSGVFTVWKAAGIPSGDARQEALRRVALPAAPGPLARVLEGKPWRLAGGNEISARLGCADAADAVLVPIVIAEKVTGALYADAVAAQVNRFDPEAVAFLAFLSGLFIERLPARRLRPSPALREIEPAAASPRSDEDETGMLDLWQESPASRAAEEPPPPAEAKEASTESEPARDNFPPPPAEPPSRETRRLTGPLAPAGEEERRTEARRFAQFLVSEIKLYNERAVQEGRQQGNLYRRLKEEIDLSRQMYEERIPASIRAGSDFLREELVRILADGHAEYLGI
jgi:hypothetical protein